MRTRFKVEEDGRCVYDMLKSGMPILNMKKGQDMMVFDNLEISLSGDLRFTFYDMDYTPPRQEVRAVLFLAHCNACMYYHLDTERRALAGSCLYDSDALYSDSLCVCLDHVLLLATFWLHQPESYHNRKDLL